MDYGSREWIEAQYRNSPGDPWGLDWRPSQKYRYARMYAALAAALGGDSRPRAVIDIGCATGDFTALLAGLAATPGSSLLGVDIADSAVARAAARFPHIRFARMALDECAAAHAGGADLVSCLEVLYYLPAAERPAAVAALRRMLRPGGLLLASSMTAPAPYFSLAELRALVGRELTVIDDGQLYLKPLVKWEKLLMKLRVRRSGNPAQVAAIERLSYRLLGARAQSHGYVIARLD